MIKRYLTNIAYGFDQLLNAFLFGDPDETISSRAGKNIHKPQWCLLCKFLDLFEKDHCQKAIERDEGKDDLFRGQRDTKK